MRTRNGFVSNSSSSSFVIHESNYDNVFSVALNMIPSRDECYFDNEKLLATIAVAAKKGKDPNTPIAFRSINYDTFIVKIAQYYVVSTCNNHFWELNGESYDLPPVVAKELNVEEYGLEHEGIWVIETFLDSYTDFWFPEADIEGRVYRKPSKKTRLGQRESCEKHYHEKLVLKDSHEITCLRCEMEKKNEDQK